MMKAAQWWIGGLLVLGAGLAIAQNTPRPIKHLTFEEDTIGWVTPGNGGKISIAREAANVKEGKGALQFDYTIDKGQFELLTLMIPDGELAKMKSLRFWIKADGGTPIIIGLQEKDGGRYQAAFTPPKDAWQEVQLAVSDFELSTGPDDPKDPDGKLDMDKVNAISVVDFGTFAAQKDESAKLFSVKSGAHKLFLDDLSAGEEVLPSASSTGGEAQIDKFNRPQLSWMIVGGKISLASGKPLDGKGLQADYKQLPSPLAFVGLVRSLPKGILTGTKEMMFSAAAKKPVKLVVQIEQEGDIKHNTTVELPGGAKVQDITVNFGDFKPSDDSKDKEAKLDLSRAKTLILLDITGPADQVTEDNTLWVNKIRAK